MRIRIYKKEIKKEKRKEKRKKVKMEACVSNIEKMI